MLFQKILKKCGVIKRPVFAGDLNNKKNEAALKRAASKTQNLLP
jgi:hypothetical protein